MKTLLTRLWQSFNPHYMTLRVVENGFRIVADDRVVCFPSYAPAPYTIIIEQGKITCEGRKDDNV